MQTASKTMDSVVTDSDLSYFALRKLIENRLASVKEPMYTVRTGYDLMNVFLSGLPDEARQHYNCNHCRAFIDKYGGLVTINEAGQQIPVVWGTDAADVPMYFLQAASDLYHIVRNKSRVDGVFLSSLEIFGTPSNTAGPGSKYHGQTWTHFFGKNPNMFKHPVRSAEQMMAEKKEEYELLHRSLRETSLAVVREAVRVLEANVLPGTEKAIASGQWFLTLREAFENKSRQIVDNLIWRAVATAPPGFAHAKNNMLGTLFTDIAEGMDFKAVSKRWADKMAPTKYMRPQAISDGQLEAAEKLVEKMGIAKSLVRRYARLDEVVALWKPSASVSGVANPGSSVFGHLKEAQAKIKPLYLPSQTMTWTKFRNEVMPKAEKIELHVPSHGSFYGLTTASDPTAPPIIQWDTEPRNPVAWYVYASGSSARQWNLEVKWVEVPAIMAMPCHWYHPDKFTHEDHGVMFVIPGARDLGEHQGNGLFPSFLRNELHEVRAAIEAYSRKAKFEGRDEMHQANGLVFRRARTSSRDWHAFLRVTAGGHVTDYTLDRWD